jgi:hypothetical protein
MKKHIIAALLITALVGVAADTAKPNKAPVKATVNVDALKKELVKVKKENDVLRELLARANEKIGKSPTKINDQINNLSHELKVKKNHANKMKFFDKNKNGTLEWPSEIGTRFGPTAKQWIEFWAVYPSPFGATPTRLPSSLRYK